MDKTKKEPIKNGKLWIVFGLLFAMITPGIFLTASGEILIYGVPLWAVIIIIASLLLSAFLSYVLKYHWMLEEDKEEAEKRGVK